MRSARDLPPEEVNQVLHNFRAALVATSGEAFKIQIEEIPRDRLLDLLCLRQQQFKELLADILGAAWLSSRASSPIGADTKHLISLTMVMRKNDGKVSWELSSAERNDPTAAALLSVTTARGFGFGVCGLPSCRKIFARRVRGRPQKYCSAACKARGVPSAKKRSAYVSAYRTKKRHEDVRRVYDLIKRCKNRAERYALLRRTFPGRPAKSLLYVMRQAEKLLDAKRRGRQAKPNKRGSVEGSRARRPARIRNGRRRPKSK
jgi:hypothetical protein